MLILLLSALAFAGQYASDVLLIVDRNATTGVTERKLVLETYAPVSGPEIQALRANSSTLPLLDAYVAANMQPVWAQWWAAMSVEEREAFRVILAP